METVTIGRLAAIVDGKGFPEVRQLLERLERKVDKGKDLRAGDLLGMSEFQLMSHLDVTYARATELLQSVADLVAPQFDTAQSILENDTVAFCPLDIIKLKAGHLVEVAGRAGVGKTQLCLTCAVEMVLNTEKVVVFIDTENKFSVDRVVEIIERKMHLSGTQAFTVRDLAKRIHVVSPSNAVALKSAVESLDNVFAEKPVGLVVLDSIASLTRHDFRFGGDISKRQSTLAKLAAKCKTLAELFRVPFLITNQVISSFGNDQQQPFQIRTADKFGIQDESSWTHTGSVVGQELDGNSYVALQPALGNTWSHCVNVRVVFSVMNDSQDIRKARVAKSPESPELECTFKITAEGVSQIG